MTEENNTPEEHTEMDMYWLVANFFAILAVLEDKFGIECIERIVQIATAMEAEMRKEAQDQS